MATLYRKYRSQTFDEMIGQEPIVTTLINQIKMGRIGHAYLFTGSRGIGKTSCARIFARAVNCLHPKDGNPCGECDACKALASGDSVDIIELDAASNNGVDDARDIREKVKYLPVSCRYKVYIIDEVHMLTGGAFNALLKTLEEPPDHVIFILATTEPQKLPQTILSRCIRFDFRLVPTDVLAKHIARVYDAEGIKYTEDAVAEIARQGEGSVRDALSVADTIASAADVITLDTVLALTGAGESETIGALFDCAAARDVAGALAAVGEFASHGKSMAAVCDGLTEYARNVLVVKSVGREKAVASGLLNVDTASAERIAKSAGDYTLRDVSRILENFAAAASGLKYSVNPRVYLETALVKLICGADADDDIRKRVAALERRLSVVPTADQKKNIAATEPQTPPVARQNSQRRQTAYDEPPPPEEPPAPLDANASAQTPARQSARVEKPQTRVPQSTGTVDPKTDAGNRARTQSDVKGADEGEFRHLSAQNVTGLALLGGIATYLRKKGTREAARARELLSRGVAVKERSDVVSFVTPDEHFLPMSDDTVIKELTAAVASLGIKKPARVDKTVEDLLADDYEAARELFGKDLIINS